MRIRTGRVIASMALLVSGAALAACASIPSVPGPTGNHARPSAGKHNRTATPSASPTPRVTQVAAEGPNGSPVIGVAHSYWTGYYTTTFTEPAHVGPDHHHLTARKLLTQLWYPLAGRPSKTTPPAPGPFPVLAFAPGFMQCGGPYSDLLKYWASAGYVIVTVNFPHADCVVGKAATENDLLNEPYDMSYVITQVLERSRARQGLLAGLLNKNEIGIAGQSDGGAVVAAILGNTCCTDQRVRAVAVESGDEWPPMAGRYFTRPTVPVLFSQGSADTINPPGCSVTMYLADRSTARYYLDLFGASHTEPYWGINSYEQITARVTLAFMNRYVLGQKAEEAVMASQGNVLSLAALYSGGGGGDGLTSTYCNT
jgi:dienelactone hydrolase